MSDEMSDRLRKVCDRLWKAHGRYIRLGTQEGEAVAAAYGASYWMLRNELEGVAQ